MSPQSNSVQPTLPLQFSGSSSPAKKKGKEDETKSPDAGRPGPSGFDLTNPDTVHRVPVHRIREDQSYNIRQDLGKIDEFASSLLDDNQEIYLEQPMVLRYRGGAEPPHSFVVKHGHRRLAGIRYLVSNHPSFKGKSLKDVSVRAFIIDETRADVASMGRDVVSQYRHNNGKPLSQMELVRAIRELRDGPMKLSDEQIREKLGLSKTAMHDVLLLTRLSNASTQLIQSGRINPSLAGEFARRFPHAKDSEEQLVEADRVAAAEAKHDPFDWAVAKRYGDRAAAKKGINPEKPPYRIKPRHSKGLLAARKATLGTKSGGQKKVMPTKLVTRTIRPAIAKRTEQLRAFLSTAPQNENPLAAVQRQTVLTVLDCLEQKRSVEALLQALGYPADAIAADALASQDEEVVQESVVAATPSTKSRQGKKGGPARKQKAAKRKST